MDALTLVESAKQTSPQPVFVLAGAERFLKQLVLVHLRQSLLGGKDDDFGYSSLDGETAEFAQVRDELDTLPFLAARRMVVVKDADPFVTRYRELLERYIEKPSRTGTLVLDVKTWKSNTRLARVIPASATVTCSVPERGAAAWLRSWLGRWAQTQHGKRLEPSAASLLVDLVGEEMGVLDQELAKLSCYVGDRPHIQQQDVDQLVAHSRSENVWQLFDAMAQGRKAEALSQLQHLLVQGQEPIAILGALSWQLRRLQQLARLQQQGLSFQAALSKAGLFRVEQVNQLLRHLGPRVFKLYDWLLEADLSLKSSGQLPQHTVLERLIIRLAEPSSP